ncbi:hypothetical protein HYC85_005960 [Camellia sinensis]|uniref:Ion transport domain-containing protein n=1 Tax=Camellia sinensis TaxID=4442 RepID=A0A7J7I1U6_CAMSI|nr:hypothetical protein HYC85_005960 [Camellia sinensis]
MLSICIPSLSTFPKMSRWTEIFRSSESEPDNDNLTGCYECTRVGGPIFHSTSCEADHQPEWEALAGSSLVPIQNRSDYNPQTSRRTVGRFGSVLDPRSASVRVWNRVVFMARGIALAVDPLFFFAVAISLGCERPCVYMDGRMAAIVAVVRTCVDAVQLCHLCIQFRLAYVSRESLGVGCGKLVWDARAIAYNYLRSLKAFWFDAFVIVPLPQVVYLLVVPKLLREERVQLMWTILQLIFLLQFLPKVYHSFSLMQRMRKVTGYIFGSIWWGFGLNLIAYFLASHVAGGYWYILSIRRVASCLSQQCNNTSKNKKCFLSLCCSEVVSYVTFGYHCGTNSTKKIDKTPLCLDGNGPFRYGIFQFALPLISSDSIATKILYSNLWGLMALR